MPLNEQLMHTRTPDQESFFNMYEEASCDVPKVSKEGTLEHERIMQLRHDFVVAMGWLKDVERNDDTDKYDEPSANSLHMYKEGEDGVLHASMRLTPVHAFDDALSVEMLGGSEEALRELEPHRENLKEICKRGNMHDLTRMVHPLDGSVDPGDIMAGMVQMIGMGIHKTAPTEDTPEPVWIFTTTIAMENALNHLGIKHEVLAGGKLAREDKEKSLFCVAYPLEALEFVRNNPDEYSFTVEHVTRGLQSQNR